MRVESSVTSLSWIPQQAVRGLTELPFGLGVAHYDTPPPQKLGNLEALRLADRFRFANHLRAWIEVDDGVIVASGQEGGGLVGATNLRFGSRTITFAAVAFPEIRPTPVVGDGEARFRQTAGGRTGAPTPRRVRHRPFVQYTAPVAWTTLQLTVRADGSSKAELVGASPFPRHWIYDDAGALVAQSGVMDFKQWYREMHGTHTPWGDVDSPALVTALASTTEQHLFEILTATGTPATVRRLDPGEVLVRQGDRGTDLFLLLDGLLEAEVDGDPVSQVGPGAVLGEQALLRDGVRTATLRAMTPVRVIVVPGHRLDRERLAAVSRSRGMPVAPV